MLRELDVTRSERLVGEMGEWLAESIFGGRRATPFLPHPIRSKGGFKALPPKAIS